MGTTFPTSLPGSKLHNWLCHPNGETCPDGCDTLADPVRLAAYFDARERAENPLPPKCGHNCEATYALDCRACRGGCECHDGYPEERYDRGMAPMFGIARVPRIERRGGCTGGFIVRALDGWGSGGQRP